jgi:hypothetical protein
MFQASLINNIRPLGYIAIKTAKKAPSLAGLL